MSLKKTNGVGLTKKKENRSQGKVLVQKSYTDDRKLKMNIVKWTAILAKKQQQQKNQI